MLHSCNRRLQLCVAWPKRHGQWSSAAEPPELPRKGGRQSPSYLGPRKRDLLSVDWHPGMGRQNYWHANTFLFCARLPQCAHCIQTVFANKTTFCLSKTMQPQNSWNQHNVHTRKVLSTGYSLGLSLASCFAMQLMCPNLLM